MKQRRRIYDSAAQRAEIWDPWKAGESVSSIGRRFNRDPPSRFSVLSPRRPAVLPAVPQNYRDDVIETRPCFQA